MTGSEAVGWPHPGLQKRLPKAVNSSGAVSPATRASDSRMAVMIALREAAGSTTLSIVFHLLAPKCHRAFAHGARERRSETLPCSAARWGSS